MPIQRYTQAARRRDARIYELLLAGNRPERVAAECGVSDREVSAAELRVEAEWSALGESEVARRRLIITCGIVASESMRAWQRSRLPVKTDDEGAGSEPLPEPAGDARHLDRALRALSLQMKHIRLPPPCDDEPPREVPAEPEETSSFEEPSSEVQVSAPLPARLFANPPSPTAPAIPESVLADVCSRAVTNGLAPRKAK